MKRSKQVLKEAREFEKHIPILLKGYSTLEQARILRLAASRLKLDENDEVEYKTIDGGQYKVYKDGRIYSVRRTRFLKGNNINGYLSYYINGQNRLGHRLVAEAFLPNPDNLPIVNHLNEIRNDNRVDNLEWSSYSENVQYSQGKHIYTNIHCYDQKGNLLKIYPILKDCEKDGLHKEGVKAVCRVDQSKRYYKQMVFSLTPIEKKWFNELPDDYFDDNRNRKSATSDYLKEVIEEYIEHGEKITIKDLAQSIGVTRQTVSNHLTIELKNIIKEHNESL